MKIIAGLAVTGMFLTMTTATLAGPKDEALAVLDKWTKAFADSDVDGIVKLYAPEALVLGTSSRDVITTPAGVRQYFEKSLLADKPRGAALGHVETMVLSDTAVLLSGLDTASGVRDGEPYNTDGRVTFVIARRGAAWLIVHCHRSAMPE